MYSSKKYSIIFLVLSFFVAKTGNVTLYRYRVYCETEQQNVYAWLEEPPAWCPNDPAHTININSISVVDQMSPNEVSIVDEYIRTNKNFKVETVKIPVAAGPNVTTTQYLSWPFNISVLNLYFVTGAEHKGDILQISAPFDRIVGAITDVVSSGTTEIPVTQTVIDNISVGYYAFLDDGTNLDELGRVTNVDAENNILTFETPTTHAFSPLTPTYVKITRRSIDFEIGLPEQYAIGMKTVKAAPVPANEQARVQYINKSSATKEFVIIYEYLY